ncbi:DMT family transporter [Candidatus Cloacimonadaceae bacterium]
MIWVIIWLWWVVLADWRSAASAKRDNKLNYILLVITAAIWGFAFVAQRIGMQSLDPLSFNTVRFALGALFIKTISASKPPGSQTFPLAPGIVLFVAASLQQIGVVYTTAGAAGFITGLYVVFVPLLGFWRGQKVGKRISLAVLLSLAGMLLINRPDDLRVSFGNMLVLLSAVFWAIHVQLIDKLSKRYSVSELAFCQYAVCALLSFGGFIVLYLVKAPSYLISAQLAQNLSSAAWPVLYGGILSVGVAYSLQVKAQQKTEASKAAIILCLEGVFALIGARLILQESLGPKAIVGMLLMLMAMLIILIPNFLIDRNTA